MSQSDEGRRKRALPTGIGEMAALITTGTSVFGYDPDRDGVPEVVIRAEARIGRDGVTAIARYAYGMTPAPTFAAAQALCEWGIEHYAGHETVLKDDGWQPEWAARGRLLRAHVMRTWGTEVAAIEGAPEDWADWVDWTQAAAVNEDAGKLAFVVREDLVTCEYQVDMFDGVWKGGQS